MNREHKFLAYHKQEQKMYYVRRINFDAQTGLPYSVFLNTIPWDIGINLVELREYTGRKDSKGTEIYEGDIVRFKLSEGTGAFFVGAVEYGKAEFIVDGTENLSSVIVVGVLGNIYENGHLLEEQE